MSSLVILILVGVLQPSFGKVGAVNKIIIDLIKKHVEHYLRNCHKMLDNAFWATRNTLKGLTRVTHYKLVFGHDIVIPLEVIIQ